MIRFEGRIGHIDGIESPWANAGGVVKSVEDVEKMASTGVGWIEAGSYTLEPRIGNSPNGETVYYHDTKTGETFNSLGMPNKGMDVVEREIPEMANITHSHNKLLMINVAPVSDEPEVESIELINRAYAAGADGVILNAGCPNVKNEDGTSHSILSRNPSGLWSVMRAIEDAGVLKPIWVRTSPQETLANARGSLSAIRSASKIVSAVLHTNTWPVDNPQSKEGNVIIDVPMPKVGKNGPAMAELSAQETRWASYVLRGSGIDIIRSSGIVSAGELRRSIADLGAVAGAGTTFYYESQGGWKEDTDRLLSGLAA